MKKTKVGVERSGSWTVCILLTMCFVFPGILYWLFKMKKTRVYQYE